ncbi:MAG: hypothetical protein ACREKJ_04780 [Candidatus Rokuibacteriota bacterium]
MMTMTAAPTAPSGRRHVKSRAAAHHRAAPAGRAASNAGAWSIGEVIAIALYFNWSIGEVVAMALF